MVRIALIAVLVAAATARADALKLEPRYNPALYSSLERTIDPDGAIYGLRFGASEKQILDGLGIPHGVIAISDTRKALLYGKTHLFILRNGKFRELRVGDHVISWDVAQQMDGNPFFDRGDWELKPGIRQRMSFEDVQKLVNRPAAVPDHKFSYDTREASVNLSFASYGESGRRMGYRLIGFSIVSFAP